MNLAAKDLGMKDAGHLEVGGIAGLASHLLPIVDPGYAGPYHRSAIDCFLHGQRAATNGLCRTKHCLDHFDVAGTAADVTGQTFDDVVSGRIGILAKRAEASMMIPGMQ